MALQVLQELLRLAAIGRQVGGDNVHVITGADGFLLFLDFGAIQIGDLAFDLLDRRRLVDGLDVHGHDQTAWDAPQIHPSSRHNSRRICGRRARRI